MVSDPNTAAVLVAIIAKSVIGILLAAGGILALYWGVRLFRDGVGLPGGSTHVQIRAFRVTTKVTTSSAGALLMLTAGGWGWLATTAFHEYKNGAVQVATSSASPVVPAKGGAQLAFAPTTTTLVASSKASLETQAEWLKTHPKDHAIVAGFSAPTEGSAAYQRMLAVLRAQAVRKSLIDLGVAPDRIATVDWANGSQGAPFSTLSPSAVVLTAEPPKPGSQFDWRWPLKTKPPMPSPGKDGSSSSSAVSPLPSAPEFKLPSSNTNSKLP